jgi:hypothetical protein
MNNPAGNLTGKAAERRIWSNDVLHREANSSDARSWLDGHGFKMLE